MYKSNRERTRDLLLEYDIAIMPPRPRAAGLSMIYTWLNSNVPDSNPIYSVPIPETAEFSIVYPWESVGLSILSDQIFILASNSGYTGTREDFHHYFGTYLENNNQEIIFEEYENFPEVGNPNLLYLDLHNRILYYWNNGYTPISAAVVAHSILEND